MIILFIYGYSKRGAYDIIISINTNPTEEPWINDLKLMPDGRTYVDIEVFPSHSLDVTFSQKTLSHACKHVCVLRTNDGACVSIIF